MRYFFLVLLFLLLIIGFTLWYREQSRRQGQRLLGLLQELEAHYERFLKQRLTLAYIRETEEAQWEQEREVVVGEALEVLRPELDAVIQVLGKGSVSDLPLKGASPFFKSVATTCEALSRKSSLSEATRRSRLYEAMRGAIQAELASRWLSYQVGDRLRPQ